MDLSAACLVNCCQGKDAGVLFRLNLSIHQHTLALHVIQVLDNRKYSNPAKANSYRSLMCVSRRLDSLAYTESLTGACSQLVKAIARSY